mgnify:CR=1 FL=1
MPGSRGSAFFVLYRGCVGMPVFRTENLAQPRGLITPVSRPPWGRSLLRPIGLHAGMRGTTPRADCACEAPRTPSFFFVREKERRGRKKKPYATFPAGGGPLPASRRALCRCGLRSPAREIKTFNARVAGGTPASCRGSPFCFLPAPPRACVTTRTEKLGDQLPRGSAAREEPRDKGGRSAPAGLVGLGRRAHTGSVEGSRKRGIILF